MAFARRTAMPAVLHIVASGRASRDATVASLRASKIQAYQGDKNTEGELPSGCATPMKNAKSWAKALRIAAAVLTMAAQIILACMG
jgi:hypothetical protein